jgi:hypothetical protein
MLPILRILPVGGVLLAIVILVLALNPPDGPRAPLNTAMAPARGALVDAGHHPETRQFLIRAALKRADELNRLRDLPDTPTRTQPAQSAPAVDEPKVAILPGDRTEADPEEPAAATETPSVSIPVQRGEITKPELPLSAPKEANAPADTAGQPKKAEQAKPAAQETHRRVVHRPRRPKVPAAAQPPFNLFEALFGGQRYQPQTYGPQTAQGKPPAAPPAQAQIPQPALQAPTEPYPQLRQHSY